MGEQLLELENTHWFDLIVTGIAFLSGNVFILNIWHIL
jgi:hypothetical protein